MATKFLDQLLRVYPHKRLGSYVNCRRLLQHKARSSQTDSRLNESHSFDAQETTQTSQVINPLEHEDFFGVRKLVTIKDLFDARVHWGHKSGTRNIYMRPFLFGTRLHIDIINLDHTLSLLHDALNFTAHIAYREGIILFISRHLQTIPLVDRAALECKEYSHCRRWKNGTFTNATMEFGSITRLPDLCIFISTHDTIFEEHGAVVESAKCNIPTVGILDTSCDPRLITYPVPGNDDTPSAIQLYCNLFSKAVLLGKEKRKEMFDKKGTFTEVSEID